MFGKQPIVEIKLSKKELNLVRLGWFLVALNFLLIAFFYFDLPNTIPTHFNYKGKVDGYGPKSSIWIFPILTLLIYFIVDLVIKKVKPWKMNYPITVTKKNAPQLYKMTLRLLIYLNLLISVLLIPTILEIIIIGHNLDLGFNISSITIVIVLFLILFPFYYIFKMYQIPNQ